ncbi:hypothetical protein IJT17_01475 [bacterium]|nr:hypothetical protein [bacterium]
MQLHKYWINAIGVCSAAALGIVLQAWAQPAPSESLPHPLPTNAADARSSPLEGHGTATEEAQICEADKRAKYAYEAAALEARYDLCLAANPLFRSQNAAVIDDLHDPLLMLGWLRQVKISNDPSPGPGQVSLKAATGSWDLYEEKPPKGTELSAKDINGDGIPDKFILGPDSCISVVSQGRVLGKTACIGAFHGRTIGARDSSLHRIDYTEVIGISNVRRLTPERISITANVRVSEALGGRLVGSYTCQRELPLDVANTPTSPSVVIELPRSLRVNKLKNVPLIGTVEAPEGIAKANLLLNGKEVWSIPEDLQLRQLALDLSLDLNPGANELCVNVWDKADKSFTKRVRFMAPPSSKVTANRALLIGTDSTSVQSVLRARERLMKRGYIVKSLRGKDATFENIAKAMDNICQACRIGDRVLIYFAGATDWNGQERVFLTANTESAADSSSRPLNDGDWERWKNELAPYRTCYIFDTFITPNLQRNGRGNVQDMQLISRLQGSRSQILTGGNPIQHLGVSTSLSRVLIDAWRNNPKTDIFDINRKCYEQLCSDPEILPLLGED